MTKVRSLMVVMSIFVLMAAVGAVAHAKKEGGKVKLPDAVAKSFKAHYPSAEITSREVEKEEGVEVYDFEFKDGAVERECDMAADGTILNSAVVVDAQSVPEAAMKAFEKAAAGGAIKRVEKSEIFAEPKAGKIVKLEKVRIEFEAELEKGGRHGEVVVTAEGAVVEGPKWGEERD